MADEQQASEQEVEQQDQQQQPDAQQEPEDAPGNENGGESQRFSQADVDRIVADRLKRAKEQADKAAAKAAEDAQRKAAEEQGKYKELYEQMQAQVQEAERRAAELEQAALRREAADKTGLPATLAERLRGETLDEMLDDAKALLAAMPKKEAAAANINGTARGTTRQAPSDDEIRQQAAQLGVSFEFMKQQYGG